MRKWLAIVMALALAFTQIGVISFADLDSAPSADVNPIVKPQQNIVLPVNPDEFPSEPKPFWSGIVLDESYFSYNSKLYPIDLQLLVENVKTQKQPYTFYYLEKEEPFFRYNGDPVRLENNKVISIQNGTEYGDLQSKKITAEVRKEEKERKVKYVLKLTGLEPGMTPQYSEVSVLSDQNSVKSLSDTYGKELQQNSDVFEWPVTLLPETGQTNLDGHICFIAQLNPEDPYTISPHVRHRLPSIIIPFGQVSASQAFGKHDYYVLKKELGETFALNLADSFEFLKEFAIGDDKNREVTRYAYLYSYNQEDKMKDFVELENPKFSMQLDKPGVYFFYFIGLDANQTRKTKVGATNYYIYVPNPYAPKLRDGVEARKTLILEAGQTSLIQFSDLFEIPTDALGLEYQVWKNGEQLDFSVQPLSYTIKGEDARVEYKFVALTYEGAVVCDFVVMTQALYDASISVDSSTTEGITIDSGKAYFPGPVTYIKQIDEPIEVKEKELRRVVKDKPLGLIEVVELNIPAKRDKLAARLTPKSLQAISDHGLLFTNDIAQILLPPDAKKSISEDEPLTFSLERKDPKKPVKDVEVSSAVYVVEVNIMSGDKPVTEFGGESISIQLPADDTFTLGKAYRVVVVSDDGSFEDAIGICKLEDGVKVVSVPIMHLSTFILTSEQKAQFTDIPENAWYEEGAKFTYERGIITSADPSKFEGMTTVPRIEIVRMLHRLAGKPMVESKAAYTDVQQGTWYSEALNWATETGIVKGVSGDVFGLYAPVTREQFLVMLQRYAEKMEIVLPQTKDIKVYRDSDRISAYANGAIQWAGTAKLVEGANGMIMPREAITKAEIATILTRFVKAHEGTTKAVSEKASQDASEEAQPQQESSETEKTPENQK